MVYNNTMIPTKAGVRANCLLSVASLLSGLK
jgi:hypothetical protein